MAACHLHTVFIIIAIILIIAFTDDMFNSVPVLLKLFTDTTNFMLIILLVILVLLVDLPCGILLAFLVLYLAIYIKRMQTHKLDRFENILLASALINNNNSSGHKSILNNIPSKYASESEFNYNRTKPFPNKNIAPFRPIDQHSIEQNTNKMVSNIACNQNDAITTVKPNNRDGYDITGCRFDFKDSTQNMTKYGPPLASCGAYNKEQITKCGTVFYPLNG